VKGPVFSGSTKGSEIKADQSRGRGFFQLRLFRLRGLLKVIFEGLMIAAGQNIKRLLKPKLEEFF